MWESLSSTEEDVVVVFRQLLSRIKEMEFDRPWSFAELNLTETELCWLRKWLISFTERKDHAWMSNSSNESRFKYIAFASLYLLAGTEVSRRESNEDEVWPTLRKLVISDFWKRVNWFSSSNGQPLSNLKEPIKNVCTVLKLRNAFDIEGTQQWFVTIKLQFGFTIKGAKSRLAEWLVGLNSPVATQHLLGESGSSSSPKSDSFSSLWTALRQYRSGRIGDAQVRQVLVNSPWIRPEWIDDLLIEAKSKIETLGTGDPGSVVSSREIVDEPECFPFKISLQWKHDVKPSVMFDFDKGWVNERTNGLDATELDFFIDGKDKKAAQWIRQQDGSWGGSASIPSHSITPRGLALCTGSNDPIEEWDLADCGIHRDVVVFDLKCGDLMDGGRERLKRNGEYALLCDKDCDIQGCEPVALCVVASRKLLRLPSPLPDQFCLSYKDFILWQPIEEEHAAVPQWKVDLTVNNRTSIALGERTRLWAVGVPYNGDQARLLVGSKVYELAKEGEVWRSDKEIPITPELAAGQKRLRFRFLIDGKSRCLVPRLRLPLLGVAIMSENEDHSDEWSYRILKNGETISRSALSPKIRIWTPDESGSADLFEGDLFVGKLRYHKYDIRGLIGAGGRLLVRDQMEWDLGITVVDNGRIAKYAPEILQQLPQIRLTRETEIDRQVIAWRFDNQKGHIIKAVEGNAIAPKNKRVWELKGVPSDALAIAIAYKGAWDGAHWELKKIQEKLSAPSLSLFAALRWFRVPILDPDMEPITRKAVMSSPIYFLSGWLSNKGLPADLEPRKDDDPIQIPRHFLWTDFPALHMKDGFRAVSGIQGQPSAEIWGEILEKIQHYSLPLFFYGVERCHGERPDGLDEALGRMLGLLDGLEEKEMSKRLYGIKKSACEATGFTSEFLEELVKRGMAYFLGPTNENQLCADDKKALGRLGQYPSGRKYLATRIIRYFRYAE